MKQSLYLVLSAVETIVSFIGVLAGIIIPFEIFFKGFNLDASYNEMYNYMVFIGVAFGFIILVSTLIIDVALTIKFRKEKFLGQSIKGEEE